MEIWQIVVICILMLPLFLIANYVVVKKAASERRSRDDRIERAVAASVAASYTDKSKRFESWSRYKAARKRKKE
ncbi:MAG: hypothetical protein WBN94_11095 [Methanothrix sp.]